MYIIGNLWKRCMPTRWFTAQEKKRLVFEGTVGALKRSCLCQCLRPPAAVLVCTFMQGPGAGVSGLCWSHLVAMNGVDTDTLFQPEPL